MLVWQTHEEGSKKAWHSCERTQSLHHRSKPSISPNCSLLLQLDGHTSTRHLRLCCSQPPAPAPAPGFKVQHSRPSALPLPLTVACLAVAGDVGAAMQVVLVC